MAQLRLPLRAGGVGRLVFTDRSHGDLALDRGEGELLPRRRAVVDAPWTWLRQVHGAGVVVVGAPGEHAGTRADAAVTAVCDAPLAVHTADCAPLALVADEGVLGVAHVGWRGLVAGVVPATVDAMRALGARTFRAVLGPCIRASSYEFGVAELEQVVAVVGPRARARTQWQTPALDVAEGVRAALHACGIEQLHDIGACTAADRAYYSHRARRETGRQALVAWMTDG